MEREQALEAAVSQIERELGLRRQLVVAWQELRQVLGGAPADIARILSAELRAACANFHERGKRASRGMRDTACHTVSFGAN